jgi:hypothetical protein
LEKGIKRDTLRAIYSRIWVKALHQRDIKKYPMEKKRHLRKDFGRILEE